LRSASCCTASGTRLIGRREFIALLAGAAAWPPPLRAQPAGMPVIGLLNALSPGSTAHLLTAFRKSLAEAGFEEGRNVAIEYRWAEGQFDRLPALAAELVRRQVSVIVATPTLTALAATVATPRIPIVFGSTDDPVKLGIVASLARPGGNATGVYFFLTDLAAKQLGLLREFVPTATQIGLMVNPKNANAADVKREMAAAAATAGVTIHVIEASDRDDIDAAFATLKRVKADALLVAADPFFFSRRLQLATLATRHAIPAVYNVREYAEAGGLMSYGTSLTDVFRQIGTYAGRILKGDKPADLPVVQSTRFEFVINLITAKALGITVPPTLLARADEVIE
jgi:putative ABC transport system substrate-binding protein